MRLALAALLTLTIAACGGDDDDNAALLACSDFTEVVSDANAGILTDAEVRDRLKDVQDTAQASDDEAIVDTATEMLAAATANDTTELQASLERMVTACEAHV